MQVGGEARMGGESALIFIEPAILRVCTKPAALRLREGPSAQLPRKGAPSGWAETEGCDDHFKINPKVISTLHGRLCCIQMIALYQRQVFEVLGLALSSHSCILSHPAVLPLGLLHAYLV